jgi:hypothetical protein
MSQRLAERAARTLGSRLGRRGFLARTAVVGTALAAAPTTYVPRPGSAYAAICACSGSSCNCGSLCCDGYTEFCCTISGQNRCPPGTLTGGWWKVDASSFCGGGSRYYLDCNAQCGSCGCGGSGICSGACSGTRCGCARGSCGNRKAGCTGFRYGQCHQGVACLGPIVCRVVSCTPPWLFDASCGTAVRTDNATRTHHRPCLTGSPFGAIDLVASGRGGIRVRGWAIDPNTTSPIRVHIYVDGVGRASVLANRTRTDIGAVYPGSGSSHGFDTHIIDIAPGSRNVCAYGISYGQGGNSLLGCRTVVASANPFGTLEIVRVEHGKLRVRGFAIDPNTDSPIRVHVYDNGRGLASILADDSRPDIAERYGRGANHGFDARLTIAPGHHDITVYAINVGSGGTTVVGSGRVTYSGLPFGRLNSVTPVGGGQVRVVGWAIDGETTSPIRVHIYANGAPKASILADQPRPELEPLGHGTAHGFDAVVNVGAGSRQVCAYAINVGAGANVQVGCLNAVVT